MKNELKKGMRIDLVEIREGNNPFAPKGSQRLCYPDELPLQYGDEANRVYSANLVYPFGHYDHGGNMKDVYDVCFYVHEVKPIGCFVVKEVYNNRNPETII